VLGTEGDDAGPKYLNSPETALFQKGHELYGLFLARRAIREAGKVLVVEGYMDVVALAQHGVEYAVATLGTATTPSHITKLMRQTDNIVFCFDGDAAGRKAAWRAAVNSLPALTDGLQLSFLFLPSEHDPDSYIREYGKEGFEAALKETLPLSQYLVQTLAEENDMQSQEGRVRFLNDAEPLLKQIVAPKLGLLLRKRVAELAHMAPGELESVMKLPRPQVRRPQAPARATRKPPTLARQLIRMVLLRPVLAQRLPQDWVEGSGAEFDFLRVVLGLAEGNSALTTVAMLELLRGRVPPELLKEVSAEAIEVDEAFAIEEEFEGALQQLRAMVGQREMDAILRIAQEKGLQALTPEQKVLLQQFRR
jgi:DNA primase